MLRWQLSKPALRLLTLVMAAVVLAAAVNRPAVSAGNFGAMIRLDRMKVSTATNIMVEILPTNPAGVSKIKLSFPSGFSLNPSSVWVSDLDPGVDPLPGGLSLSQSGQDIWISGVGSMVAGQTYGFHLASVTTPGSPGSYPATVSTHNGSGSTIETQNLGLAVVLNDQVGSSGQVGAGCVSNNGDINNDGHVNIFDLSILLSKYASPGPTGDLNCNGVVNIFDLSILLSHYGT